MKKIIMILMFFTNNYCQIPLHGPFELFIGTKNHSGQINSFHIQKAGVNWHNAAHDYLITNEFNTDSLTISGNTNMNSFQYGWDWVNSDQGGNPPYYGGVFTYGFYKFWTSDAYFYLDYRDCRFQNSSQSPYTLIIDIYLIYDGNTHSFSFIPSSTSQNEFPIQDGSIINIWDAFDSILEVGYPNQFCYEDYTENNLAVYAPLTEAKLFWAAPPPQDYLPSKYRIWYAWSLVGSYQEPEPDDYYWLADVDDAFLSFTDEAIIDQNFIGTASHTSYYYLEAFNETQSLFTSNIVNVFSNTDWTKTLKITNDNNHPRLAWTPYNIYPYSVYNYKVYRKVETIPPGRPPAVYQLIYETGYDTLRFEYTDYDFTMGGSSNIASYYVKATAGSSFVSTASNIVSSNVLYYKRRTGLIPEQFSLSQNYPNPFNPNTSISYSIPENAFVTLKIYDVLGNEVEVLINEQKESGNYQIDFNASELSSGIYYYALTVGNFTSTKKMSLVK